MCNILNLASFCFITVYKCVIHNLCVALTAPQRRRQKLTVVIRSSISSFQDKIFNKSQHERKIEWSFLTFCPLIFIICSRVPTQSTSVFINKWSLSLSALVLHWFCTVLIHFVEHYSILHKVHKRQIKQYLFSKQQQANTTLRVGQSLTSPLEI